MGDRKAREFSLMDSTTITENGNSNSIDVSDYTEIILYCDLTTAAAGETLDITIQTCPNTGESSPQWYDHSSFTQISPQVQESAAAVVVDMVMSAKSSTAVFRSVRVLIFNFGFIFPFRSRHNVYGNFAHPEQ